MARETKVGLLAGLAFIICFAIILANRGRDGANATHASYDVDPGGNWRAATVADRESRDGSKNADAGRQSWLDELHRIDSSADQATSDAIPSSGSQVLFAEEGDAARGRPVGRTSERLGTAAAQADADRLASLQEHVQPAGHPVAQAVSDAETLRQRRIELQQRLDHVGSVSAESDGPGGPSSTGNGERTTHAQQGSISARNKIANASKGAPAVEEQIDRSVRDGAHHTTAAFQRHQVVSGDTLYKIAQTQYGDRSPSIVRAIFEANRSILSDPNSLRVGMELVLPRLDAGRAAHHASDPGASATTRRLAGSVGSSAGDSSQTGAKPTVYRWYQIKKNDRYASIAREQLGDASRWPEIFALNKDKFPDPQRIREGVRIKLPAPTRDEVVTR